MKTLIVGAGPVGLAAALALKHRGVSDDITVLEAGTRDAVSFGDRNIALSSASWRFLAKLGVTVAASERAPIRQVEITQRGAFGLLRLDAHDVAAVELGAASPYPALKTALDHATHAAGIAVLYGAKVDSVQHVAQHAEVGEVGLCDITSDERKVLEVVECDDAVNLCGHFCLLGLEIG